ncbi:hypothetical protein [Devosia submarina]|uniref:hypothetical protein n=1 Tax=Devosia submarina TaxID=1173082 RepID=UPI000D3C60A2|nr:hypothetical protein [Devosia submarina]
MATIFSFSQRREKAPAARPAAPAPARDWTNQELSDLYRAVASLAQSGIVVDVDRGLTDEGDPWMVLCRLDGEVFIHFCRLDGQYLLDSPALARPLRGEHFAELVDLFIAQAARAAAPNVVAFRASKVFLHPAALLTILVWSLYVWSSDTGEAQAAEWSDDGAVLPEHILAAAAQTASEAPDAPDAPPSPAAKAAPLLDGVTPERMASRLIQAMDHAGALSAGNQAAAMQFLAVVSTLVLTSASTTALNNSGEAAPSLLTATLLPEAAPAQAPELDQGTTAEGARDLAQGLQAQLASKTAGDTSELSLGEPHTIVLASMLPEAPGEPSTAHAALHPALFVSAMPTPAPEGAHPVTLPSNAIHSTAPLGAGDIAMVLGSTISLERYHINGLDLFASFNPADMQGLQIAGEAGSAGFVDLLFDAPQLETPDAATQHGSFGEAARAIIDAFLDQAGDLQIVASANELVLIDLTAFDDTMDQAYAYSWSMEDGGTISALGHVAFFADFALV